MSDPSAVIADCETTGVHPTAEVIDLAVLAFDGTVLYQTLVCPLTTIPPEATAVHGIGERDVAKAPLLDEVWDRLAAVLDGKLVVAWNASFDRGMLDRNRPRRCAPLPVAGWNCAMLRYGAFDGTPGRYAGEFKWWKLQDACAALGIDPGGHRAAADAEATRRVVLAMAKDGCP